MFVPVLHPYDNLIALVDYEFTIDIGAPLQDSGMATYTVNMRPDGTLYG